MRLSTEAPPVEEVSITARFSAHDDLGTGGAVGHKDIVVSTVGDERLFARLHAQQRVRPALALSLHTTDAALRHRLLPRAPRIAPADLVEAGDGYARASGYPVQLQWTLMDGVNDGDEGVATHKVTATKTATAAKPISNERRGKFGVKV